MKGASNLEEKDCIFCKKDQNEYILENELVAAFWDLNPVSQGHLLFIPKVHRETFFELSDVEILAMKQLLHAGRRMLTKKFNPAGFNIGVNVGEAGGQTVMHCHFHLIPRYIGDDPNPAGGIRKLLPADHKKNS
ncbi:diadenosine tetraphosphate (Ap4A) hydrolase [Liquorilactobacillus satsumensis DSM 16230 = JCM 12392]|uniref:Diadenosine tetraphosphate (Ap4A) hydrolase n=1 Tax=Liquorilactobacillus satsumensis DSM 16230 = JCM 12392 TaxID=1423801 RepID=A0A0R1UVP5_9LACO|nr:diadenosine tetraphosphate (Ap4A) hydrolase [Liquorilactobacillus satsumensis DSM 16230 = JCM 12392]